MAAAQQLNSMLSRSNRTFGTPYDPLRCVPKYRGGLPMRLTDTPAHSSTQLVLPTAMTIVASERDEVHEKMARLRALREAAEAKNMQPEPDV